MRTHDTLAKWNLFRNGTALMRPTELRSAWLIVLLTGLSACATVPTTAVTSASPLVWNGQTRVELPLVPDEGRRPMLRTRMMGQEALALLDTGANASAVSPALAAATGARKGTLEKGDRKYDGIEDVPVLLGPASIRLGFVHVGDMPQGAQFLLGFELFSQAIVEINFDTNRLTLLHPDAFTPPDAPVLRMNSMHGLPTVELRIDGHEKSVCTIIDTGTNAGLVLSTDVVEELSLRRNTAFRSPAQGFDGRQTVFSGLAPIAELRMGDQLFRNVPAQEVPAGALHGRDVCDSILGMALLSRYNLVIDLKRQRMWLLPRSAAR